MKPRIVFTAAALSLVATTAFAADGTFDRTLSVSGAPTVSVSTGSGYIHVTPGSDNQFHVTGPVRSHPGIFSGDADARVKQIVASPPIVQSGNTITVGPSHADSDLFNNITIDYDVTAPRATALTAHSGSGNLDFSGMDHLLTGQSGSGSIHADNIGPNAHLGTGSGSVHATNVRGATTVATGSGDVQLALTAPGDVNARTGSGSIHVEGAAGGIQATAGSGSIEASGNPTAEWRLQTGSGSIRIHPAPSARFNLNAETGSGSIRTDLPMLMQGSLNKHHVTGSVNGGGPTVRASTGSGSVTLQ